MIFHIFLHMTKFDVKRDHATGKASGTQSPPLS
jgi:hypothetical protein